MKTLFQLFSRSADAPKTETQPAAPTPAAAAQPQKPKRSAAHLAAYRFKKGQTGNPGGKPKAKADTRPDLAALPKA